MAKKFRPVAVPGVNRNAARPHKHSHQQRRHDARHYHELASNAVRDLLVEKGIISESEIEQELKNFEARGPNIGARIVAKAWANPTFKRRLLANGKAALAEIGIKFGEAQFFVVENTNRLHNVICCTLCSCYPRSILGQPPHWYTVKSYRSRAIREPRRVLREFGLRLPPTVSVNVYESNADTRYMVLPRRPRGTTGWTEEQLGKLVTRDSLIGTAEAVAP
jgi:nitrile hydratase